MRSPLHGSERPCHPQTIPSSALLLLLSISPTSLLPALKGKGEEGAMWRPVMGVGDISSSSSSSRLLPMLSEKDLGDVLLAHIVPLSPLLLHICSVTPPPLPSMAEIAFSSSIISSQSSSSSSSPFPPPYHITPTTLLPLPLSHIFSLPLVSLLSTSLHIIISNFISNFG